MMIGNEAAKDNIGYGKRDLQPKKKDGFKSRRVKRGLFIAGMLSVGLIQFLVFWVYVNFNSILMAFQTRTRTGVQWGFENFSGLEKHIASVCGGHADRAFRVAVICLLSV